MPTNTVRQTLSVKLPSERSFQRVLAAVREGNTLDAACSMKNMPTKEAVLKLLSDSPECEARMVRARRIGVWMQPDSIHERLNSADPAELQVLKELASLHSLAGRKIRRGYVRDEGPRGARCYRSAVDGSAAKFERNALENYRFSSASTK